EDDEDRAFVGHHARLRPTAFGRLQAWEALAEAAGLGARLLGPGDGLAVEVAVDGTAVRPGDARGVGGEAFIAHGLPVLDVGSDHVLAGDVPRGGEEREPDAAGDLEQ